MRFGSRLTDFIASVCHFLPRSTRSAQASRTYRLPPKIHNRGATVLTLALLSILRMALTGYLLGLRERRYGSPTVVMIITYATVFMLAALSWYWSSPMGPARGGARCCPHRVD